MGKLVDAIKSSQNPLKAIEYFSERNEEKTQLAAAQACENQSNVPNKIILCLLSSRYYSVTNEAERIFADWIESLENASLDTIEELAEHESPRIRLFAAEACKNRADITDKIATKLLTDDEDTVVDTAMKTFAEWLENTSVETIKDWSESDDWEIRRLAARVCEGRTDIPDEIAEKLLSDEDEATTTPAETVGPKIVYKKVKDGIVVAEIPDDAIIVGSPGSICRTNKALILEVRAPLGIGVSLYDPSTAYTVGELVIIENFSRGGSTGFYFFYTEEEALRFRF